MTSPRRPSARTVVLAYALASRFRHLLGASIIATASLLVHAWTGGVVSAVAQVASGFAMTYIVGLLAFVRAASSSDEIVSRMRRDPRFVALFEGSR